MKIVSLVSENVKRIKAISVTPTGSLVMIEGKNGQGKSSLLDSIQYALGGVSTQPPEVIRQGETKASVVLDLEDLIVERRWTSKGTHLEVRSKEGAVHKSPQAMLDKLVGSLSFDPLAYVRLPAKAQADQLRALVGVDVSDLEASRKSAFERRTHLNRDLSQVEARLKAAPIENAPDEPVDVKALLSEQEKLQAEKARNDDVRRCAEAACGRAEGSERAAEQAKAEVDRLARLLTQAKESAEIAVALNLDLDASRDIAEMDAAALVDPDMAPIREQIANASKTNEAVARKKARAKLASEAAELSKAAEQETRAIESADLEKARRLGAAKFPAEGLGFNGDGVTFGGLPLQQASSAQQLRVAMATGLAANPKLKIVLIREGSLLDEDSLAMVAKMADESGAQVWIESVASKRSDGCTVFIEDGQAVDA